MNLLRALLLQLLKLLAQLLIRAPPPPPPPPPRKPKMAEVAQDAFNSRDYHLAAELFEKCFKEGGVPRGAGAIELHFRYADSLAHSGRVHDAAAVYQSIYTRACAPERLRPLAVALMAAVQTVAAQQPPPTPTLVDPLACVVCADVLKQPVSWNCGHCACAHCDQKNRDPHCLRCGKSKGRTKREVNVLVNNLVQKFWPHHLNVVTLRDEGNKLFREGRLKEALDKYNTANELVRDNPVVLANRSHVQLILNRPQVALADADTVIRRRPMWPKGYYRRSMALSQLGRHEEALISLACCAALESNPNPLRHEMCLALHRVLTPPMRASSSNSFWMKRRRKASSDCEDSGDEEYMTPHHADRSRQDAVQGLLDRVLQAVEQLKKSEKGNHEFLENQVVCKAEQIDFECVLCSRTLWRPVTTHCGHTYCWACLDRCIDYSHPCPLCMAPLTESVAGSERSVLDFVDKAVSALLPNDYKLRQIQEQEQASESQRRIPVFVCTTGFPGTPCPLFIYEPRYRLMVRRAILCGNRQFGMVACTESGGRYAEFGTMLEIRDCLQLNNGCSIVTSIGVSRFRVLGRGEKDGYDVAQVEALKDETIPAERLDFVQALHDEVRARAKTWISSVPERARSEIDQTFGPMPSIESDWKKLPDGPHWTWWLIAILPLGTKLKVGILGTTSLEKRLLAINKTLEHLNSRSQ